MSQRDDEVFTRCEKLGEVAVRDMIERTQFEILDSECAKKWLRLKDLQRTIRSEERAEKALTNSMIATGIAIIALVLREGLTYSR